MSFRRLLDIGLWAKKLGMAEGEPSSETPDSERGSVNSFDHYASVANPNLMIFVPNGTVPPFRFKAGGWDLLESSIELGPVMNARIAEKGYFLCRVKDDRTGWAELTEPSS